MESAMRRLAALLVLVTVLGCGGDSSTSPKDTAVTGTYNLKTVNRIPLPFIVLQSDSVKYEILNDAFTLKDDKTWSESGSTRTTYAGEVSTDAIADSGTYVLSGTRITLISTNGSVDGTVGGGTLTLVNDAVAAVYQK
jgi:hypothetical protein